MVRTSMDVDVYNVSIHGWANNAHRTSSHLPSNFHHAISAPMPVPSRLPDGSHALQDNIQHLCSRESMAVASLREKNSFHPQAPPQDEEAKRAFAYRINKQHNTQDSPCPNHGLRLQGWLSCGRMAEGVAHLSPSKEAPILSPTNFHRSVKHD